MTVQSVLVGRIDSLVLLTMRKINNATIVNFKMAQIVILTSGLIH